VYSGRFRRLLELDISRETVLAPVGSPQPRTGFSAQVSACRCSRRSSLADLKAVPAGLPLESFFPRVKVLRIARAPGVGTADGPSATIVCFPVFWSQTAE
jgi:hypothetical protein